ncbi:cytochrome-c peroxidase [Flagellimonas algicola]|uniref:C-type cytochrome n=1 Tax=Flagellimonas algicola TaxID=2583815 RepID=A0ABY2WPY8_9FLAO|nr:cytochrome c peroxidase [Allomuricauda algicola]TMU56604.1 c-type cytochrome [Allomuricauda algicola]
MGENTSSKNRFAHLQGLFLIAAVFIPLGCGGPKAKEPEITKTKVDVPVFTALPQEVPYPQDNPPSRDKEILGKLLFYDPILSGDKDVSCATCHHPEMGYAEFLDISIGPNAQGMGSKRNFLEPNSIPFVKRNAQTILNTAFNGMQGHQTVEAKNAPMFWDDRVQSLEKQALEPIKALEEMRGPHFTEEEILQVVVGRLQHIPEYQELFKKAFDGENPISVSNLGKAIASFERTLVANNSRFDQYMNGDRSAISLLEKDGFEQFKKVGCANCHNGPMFSDYKFHVLGVPENKKLPLPDLGRADKQRVDSFAFRTPSLRNLRFTAPYMHNGSFMDLRRVLEFYEDIAHRKIRNKNVPKSKFDPLVAELKLSVKEMSQIISFLNTLNDPDFDKSIPERVPSGLPVGGHIQ